MIRAGDFDGIVRDALLREPVPGGAKIPSARPQAAEWPAVGRRRRRLSATWSSPIRRSIGKTLKVPALLSDDADLYFKGYQSPVNRMHPS